MRRVHNGTSGVAPTGTHTLDTTTRVPVVSDELTGTFVMDVATEGFAGLRYMVTRR